MFSRYRPKSHFIAPHSWSNDPCGAVYVPESGEYLVCYQWNPGTTDGGNCAWGMAKSTDMATWTDCTPALWNGATYDKLGVFSGSIVSRLVNGRRVLYLFYTSVSALPIHFSKPYIKGCESQSVAISTDLGQTWTRHAANPLVKSPPKGDATTGWRDPFVTRSSSLSALLGVTNDTEFMMIASGERSRGPQLHLYSSTDMVTWDFVSTVLDARKDDPISPDSMLSWGVNFECATFFSINNTDYILIGVEEEDSSRHNGHYLLWVSGRFSLRNGLPSFEISAHGMLDHGVLYAAHVFANAHGQLIQLGWADEAASKQVVRDQGWAGCLGHPRELVEIVRPYDTCARDDWAIKGNTMTTLGVRPAQAVEGLRGGVPLSLEEFAAVKSTNYEICVSFADLQGSEKLRFSVLESEMERTEIVYDTQKQAITVDRSESSLKNLGASAPDVGTLRLLPGENLELRIFVDVSMIEVFANDRLAITSRVYPSLTTSRGASYDFGGYRGGVRFQCWDSLRNAWPQRELAESHLSDLCPTPPESKDIPGVTEAAAQVAEVAAS